MLGASQGGGGRRWVGVLGQGRGECVCKAEGYWGPACPRFLEYMASPDPSASPINTPITPLPVPANRSHTRTTPALLSEGSASSVGWQQLVKAANPRGLTGVSMVRRGDRSCNAYTCTCCASTATSL
jgi:hypothetical protein